MNIKGFTLLELIVVLIVLASLIAIALPQYTSFVERSRAAEVIHLFGLLKSAEEANYIMTNKYEPSIWAMGLAYIADNPRWTVSGHTPIGEQGYDFTFSRKNTEGCPPDQVNKWILMEYDRATGETKYSGTHIGAPH